jgi:hypothetical protein
MINVLLNSQNSDGGWGAVPQKHSQTEATAYALLALTQMRDLALSGRVNRGLQWLLTQQQADGSWPLMANLTESSWTSALAVFALAHFEDHRSQALRGAEWLLQQKGRTLGLLESLKYRLAPSFMATELNPDLQAWPWAANSFSWVEPTAYALLALKKLRPFLRGTQADQRIRQGELLLYDRMCKGGGWNYGNVRTLGEEILPYPDTTAVALLALQDRQTEVANQQSLQALRHMLGQVQSGLALSLALLCFSVYGQDHAEWKSQLRKRYDETRFLDETKVVALALLALNDGAAVFRV